MKDYYQILGVEKGCSDDELRRSYRKLAMKWHPDKNPDDAEAQEKFKEIAEAYGVLSDPEKRKQYERFGSSSSFAGSNGFSYSQEEIFRDLFNDPKFQQMFHTVLGEFQRSGLRSGPDFVQKSFFGKKNGGFVGGMVFFGSLAGHMAKEKIKQKLPKPEGIMRSLGQKFGRFLGYDREEKAAELPPSGDILYTLELSRPELIRGKEVEVLVPGQNGEERLKVQVPAGSRPGQKLRLRGRGADSGSGRGDLYLELSQS